MMRKFFKFMKQIAPVAIPLILLSIWLGGGYIPVFQWLEIYKEMRISDRTNTVVAAGSIFFLILMLGGVARVMWTLNKDSKRKNKMTDERLRAIRRSVPRLMLPTFMKLVKKYPDDYAKWVISNSSHRSRYRDIKRFAADHFPSWSEDPLTPQDKYKHIACHILSMHLLGGTTTSVSVHRIGSKGEFEYVLPRSIPMEDELWVRIVSHLAPISYMRSSQKSLIEHDVLIASDLALQLSAIGRNPTNTHLGSDVSSILDQARSQARATLRGLSMEIDSIANSIQEKRSMNSHQVKIALQKAGL